MRLLSVLDRSLFLIHVVGQDSSLVQPLLQAISLAVLHLDEHVEGYGVSVSGPVFKFNQRVLGVKLARLSLSHRRLRIVAVRVHV